MNERMKWLPLLLVGVLALAGCGDEESDDGGGNGGHRDGGNGEAAAPANAPKAVCMNFIKAVHTGNQELFLDSLAYEDRDEEMLVAMFGFLSATQKLQTKALDAYGPQGAALLVKDTNFPSMADVEETITIEESGDTATATMPDQDEPMELIKVDGVWKAKLPGKDLPPAENRPQAIAMMNAMAAVMNEAIGNIGKEGYTAEKVEQEMKAAMMENMQNQQPSE
ncbi:MAG: hypothetical protein GVY16_03050 [Planctomycetes bacterium]|nr:hypothetical protein [Planctomycetota bacterium]